MAWNFEEKCKFDSNENMEDLKDYAVKTFKGSFMNIDNFSQTDNGFKCEIKNILLSWNNYRVQFDLKQQDKKLKLELAVEPKFRLLAKWPLPPFFIFAIPGGLLARILRKRKFEKYVSNLSIAYSK